MSISENTVSAVALILRRQIAPVKLAVILSELHDVPGSAAFREAIEQITAEVRFQNDVGAPSTRVARKR